MNEIRMYLKTSGSIAELYKDFNLYKGSYQNVLLSVYVPKSLLYENEKNTFSNVVKTGAILTAQNGTKITTKAYYADYVKDETVLNVEYAVYSQHLPKEYVVYAGTQTVIANVVNLDITDPDSPVVLSVTTSQTANLVVQESAYLSDTDIVPPDELDTINARLAALESGKLDKQTMSSGQYRAYVVTPDGNQGTIGIIDGSVSSAEQLANNIARYDSFGRLATSTPTENQHATSKQYVDDADENLSNEIETLRQDIDSKSHFRGYLTTAEIQSLLNPDNGDYAWSSDTLTVWSYNGSAWVNTGNPVPDQTVPKGDSIPLPDAATGSAGSSTSYAGIDHVHPQSAIYESASAANAKWQAQGQVNDTLTEGVNEALSDIPLAPEQTGEAITGENALNNAKVSVLAESKNLFTTAYKSYSQSGVYTANGTNGFIWTSSESNVVAEVEFTFTPKAGRYTISFNATCVNSPDSSLRPNEFLTFEDGQITGSYQMGGDQTAQSHSYTFTKKTDGSSLRLSFYTSVYSASLSNYSMKIENVQLEIGEVATPYTPYVTDGTAVNITDCGKNLFNTHTTPILMSGSSITNVTDTSLTIRANSANTSLYQAFEIKGVQDGDTVTLKMNWTKSGENDPCARLWWHYDGTLPNPGIIGSITESGGTLTATLNKPTSDAKLCVILYVATNIAAEIGDTATFTDVQLEIGGEATKYAQYESETYPATVGQSVEIVQYDKITNVFTDNAGVTVSAAFKQSTRYELDDRLVPLFGAFASRPTDIQPYARLYVATDQTDDNKVTILPANTDGSVSENWITI